MFLHQGKKRKHLLIKELYKFQQNAWSLPYPGHDPIFTLPSPS